MKINDYLVLVWKNTARSVN